MGRCVRRDVFLIKSDDFNEKNAHFYSPNKPIFCAALPNAQRMPSAQCSLLCLCRCAQLGWCRTLCKDFLRNDDTFLWAFFARGFEWRHRRLFCLPRHRVGFPLTHCRYKAWPSIFQHGSLLFCIPFEIRFFATWSYASWSVHFSNKPLCRAVMQTIFFVVFLFFGAKHFDRLS